MKHSTLTLNLTAETRNSGFKIACTILPSMYVWCKHCKLCKLIVWARNFQRKKLSDINSKCKIRLLKGERWMIFECFSGETSSLQCWLMEGTRQKKYRPLLDRPRCESLESRIQHFVKRGRLEQEEGENGEETTVFRGKRSKHSHLTTTNRPQEQKHGAKTEDSPLQTL